MHAFLSQRGRSARELVRLFSKLYGRYRGRIALLIALGFVSGLLGGVGIGILIPLFTLVVEGNVSQGDDFFSERLVPLFERFHIEPRLGVLLTVVASLFILKAIAMWCSGYLKARIATAYTYALRSELYEDTLRAHWPYLIEQKLGHLAEVVMGDISVVVQLLKRGLTSILNTATFLVYLAVAFTISTRVTLLALLMGALILLATRPFVRRARRYAKESEVIKKQIVHRVNENIVGLKSVKSLHAEGAMITRDTGFFRRLEELSMKFFFTGSVTSEPVEPLGVLFIAGVFAFSYKFDPNFSLPSFLVVVYLIQQIFLNVNKTQRSLHSFNTALPHLYRVATFGDAARANREENPGSEPFVFRDALTFEDVRYRYHDERPILEGLGITVRKGEMVGIIGTSGAGKTTIVDLLLRLLNPQRGRILLDGKDIKRIDLGAWRRSVGYMPQDVFLVNDTVRENIAFYDPSISDTAVRRAAGAAQIAGHIERLPKGYDTIMGERGAYFSGGERQRIALARILARDPQILVLDEAMSALDGASEAAIKSALARLKGEVTTLIISHRLSTVADCDRVLLVEHGAVVEEGSPRALLENPASRFHALYAAR